jgi:hypothetical protein
MMEAAALLFAAAALASPGEVQPPRPLGNPGNAVDRCYALHSRRGLVTGEVEVTVMVDAEGRPTGATSPADTPERLAAAANVPRLLSA